MLSELISDAVQQRLGISEIGGIEALIKPIVDRLQQLAGIAAASLLVPQARQAGGGPELPRFRTLLACDGQRRRETGLRFGGGIQSVPLQKQGALECVKSGLVKALAGAFHRGQRFGDSIESLPGLAVSAVGPCQRRQPTWPVHLRPGGEEISQAVAQLFKPLCRLGALSYGPALYHA